MRQVLVEKAMSDELNNVILEVQSSNSRATSKCLCCVKLLNFTRTVHLNAVSSLKKCEQKKERENLDIHCISHNLILA